MPPKFQALTPLTKPPAPRKVGAWDTEGNGDPGGYVDGGLIVEGEYVHAKKPEQLFHYMGQPCNHGTYFYAHNLTYDLGVVLRHIPYPFKANFVNGGAYLVRLWPRKHRPFYFGDSLRLSAHKSLAEVGKALALPKLATPPQLLPEGTKVEEWYCTEHGRLWCVPCYLKRDVEIAYKYMTLFQKEINALGGELKDTLASTAMDLFRRRFLDREYYTPFVSRNEFARGAYYGGRVEPFVRGRVEGVYIYDINSLYPYVMREFPFPDPNTLHGPEENANINKIFTHEGVSDVEVEIPPMHLPPLPFRDGGHLFFPVGAVRGVYTHSELRRAVVLGCRIKQCWTSLWSEGTCLPFAEFVDGLYQLRLRYKATRDPREHVVKILLNSLYGKFGQRQDAGLKQLMTVEEWEALEDKAGFEPYELDGGLWMLRPLGGWGQPCYLNVLWAAYITSYARLRLLDYLEAEANHVLYCDTDSIFTTRPIGTGTALGEMKLVLGPVIVEIIGPKCYRWSEDGINWRYKVRGVPHDWREDYFVKGQATYPKALGFFEARVRGLSPSAWVEVTKHLLATTEKRVFLDQESPHAPFQRSRPHFAHQLPR